MNQLPDVGRVFFEGRDTLSGPLPCKEDDYCKIIIHFFSFPDFLWTVSILKRFYNWMNDNPDPVDFSSALEKLPTQHGVSKKVYLAVIRHALGGEKVS
jgi:hypothetical protein